MKINLPNLFNLKLGENHSFKTFERLFREAPARKTIARGTTDQEIDSVTWIKFSNNMEPLSCKFGHQMAQLALVANLATRWRHLH